MDLPVHSRVKKKLHDLETSSFAHYKEIKIEPSATKTMATVLWDCEGLLLCEFLPPKTTINSSTYCKTLKKLHKAIKRKRSGRLTAIVRLLHDGAQPHTSVHTAVWLKKQKWEVLQHPPHSRDLAPSDFYLFGQLKFFYREKDLRTKPIAKNNSCAILHMP
jgi:hypothetical protein